MLLALIALVLAQPFGSAQGWANLVVAQDPAKLVDEFREAKPEDRGTILEKIVPLGKAALAPLNKAIEAEKGNDLADELREVRTRCLAEAVAVPTLGKKYPDTLNPQNAWQHPNWKVVKDPLVAKLAPEVTVFCASRGLGSPVASKDQFVFEIAVGPDGKEIAQTWNPWTAAGAEGGEFLKKVLGNAKDPAEWASAAATLCPPCFHHFGETWTTPDDFEKDGSKRKLKKEVAEKEHMTFEVDFNGEGHVTKITAKCTQVHPK